VANYNEQLPKGTDLEEVHPFQIGAVTTAESENDRLIVTSTSLTALERSVAEMDGVSEKIIVAQLRKAFKEVRSVRAGGTFPSRNRRHS
jgi:hypothetical protein